MELKEALASLDTEDDLMWTEGGMPKVDVIKELTGDDTLKRQDITDAAPQFTRENPVIEIGEDEEEDEDEQEAEDQEEVEEVSDPSDFITFEGPVAYFKEMMQMDEAELRSEADRLANRISSLAKLRAEAQLAMEQNQLNHSNVKSRLAAIQPANRPQRDIQEHIRKQNELRAGKINSVAAIKKAIGVDGNVKLDGRSPLDQAFDKKGGRGSQRPVR